MAFFGRSFCKTQKELFILVQFPLDGKNARTKRHILHSLFHFRIAVGLFVKLVGNLEEKLFNVQSSALKKTFQQHSRTFSYYCIAILWAMKVDNVIENRACASIGQHLKAFI